MNSNTAEGYAAVFHSSGTTEQRPSRHFHDAESLALYEDSLWPWFKQHVLSDSALLHVISLTPPPAQAPNSSLVHMLETVRQRMSGGTFLFMGNTDSDGGWRVDSSRVECELRTASEGERPVLLMGTAFNFVHFLDALGGTQLTLPPGSRIMETGGYKGRSRTLPKQDLHQWLQRQLGIGADQIICEYGMCELSSQAYDQRFGTAGALRLFRFPPWARVRILSPETGREVEVGETGLVRILDLANLKSVLGVQTEDLAIRHADGFELLGRAAHAEPRGCSLAPAWL